MKKRAWIIVAIVMVILIAGGGFYWGQQSQKRTADPVQTSKGDRVNSSHMMSSHHSMMSNATKKTSKNNLDVANMGPQTTAAMLLTYGRNLRGVAGTNSWHAMYQTLKSQGVNVILSKANVDKMAKPGIGVAYYIVSREAKPTASQLKNYPSYTLENDKTVHLYQPNHFSSVAKTTTLNTVAKTENDQQAAQDIRSVVNQISITDERDAGTNTKSAGDVDLTTDDESTLIKAIVFFGMENIDNDAWSGLRTMINEHKVRLSVQYDETAGGYGITYDQSGDSNCIIYYSPANPTAERPDCYAYGHTVPFSDDEPTSDDYDDSIGAPITDIQKYVNEHGGRQALDKIKLTDNSTIYGG